MIELIKLIKLTGFDLLVNKLYCITLHEVCQNQTSDIIKSDIRIMYLQRRNRILRATPAIRNMVAETILTPNDFIVPLFIDEGENVQTEIPSMPNYYRRRKK